MHVPTVREGGCSLRCTLGDRLNQEQVPWGSGALEHDTGEFLHRVGVTDNTSELCGHYQSFSSDAAFFGKASAKAPRRLGDGRQLSPPSLHM